MTTKYIKLLQLAVDTMEGTDFRKAFCGKLIDWGCFRSVYVLKSDPEYVVKIERKLAAGFCNAQEWSNYGMYGPWDALGPFLAPCLLISGDSQILIQRRITARPRNEYPKTIPNVFTDNKYENWGWIGNDFVCCDYPTLIIGMKFGMKRAKWWSDRRRGRVPKQSFVRVRI